MSPIEIMDGKLETIQFIESIANFSPLSRALALQKHCEKLRARNDVLIEKMDKDFES